MRSLLAWLWIGAGLFVLGSCGNNNTAANTNTDTPNSGTISISVDESFKPVIEQQLLVFHSQFPKAIVRVEYKSEADCWRDFQSDSTRLVIVGRPLSRNEQDLYKQKLRFTPSFAPLAMDAVTVITSKQNKDSLFTKQDLADMLSGKTDRVTVVDGNNATSLVRFLKDSVLKNDQFGKNVFAADGSKAVVNYIATHPTAVGFVSSGWVGNSLDTGLAKLAAKVRTNRVECTKCTQKGLYALPTQNTIMYREYPLVRRLYYVLKENHPGLGSGLVNFLSLERGQLIFSRSNLVPTKMYFVLREGSIQE